MAHGYPDWGQTSGVTTTYKNTDMAELAARLGSIDIFDRRGDVLFLDDFEHGIAKWILGGSGSGNTSYLDSTQARSGQLGFRMIGGSDALRYSQIVHWLPVPVPSKVGFEISWHRLSTIERLRAVIIYYDGANRYRADIQWTQATGVIGVITTGVIWQTIDPSALFLTNSAMFNTWKLVVDLTTKMYVRGISNSDAYDLSAIPMDSTALVTDPALLVDIEIYSRAGNNDAIIVDDAIITVNEPG